MRKRFKNRSRPTGRRPAPSGAGRSKLKIIPLGGLEEVGRNMTIFEYKGDILIVDMGLQFPEEDMPGIDYIIPNIESLKGKEKQIKGVVITHGHYDHIGAISHLMSRLGNPPLYCTGLTEAIIQKKHEEYKNIPSLDIRRITSDSKIKLGQFRLEFFRVNHNIPDGVGIFIRTDSANVLHAGDFKFDFSPIGEKPIEVGKIVRFGEQGVDLLMSDSTNAGSPGYQISEKGIESELDKIFSKTRGRLIIATFASLVSRIQEIINLAQKYNRKVAIEGRSMRNIVEIALRNHYLIAKRGTFVDASRINRMKDNKVLVLCTGAQGEKRAALVRIANGEHRRISIKKGDTFIFSSSIVPGNERAVQNLKDLIYKAGGNVIHYQMMDIHTGGHAKIEELKMMMRLVKPKNVMPIHGNHFLLVTHGRLAKQLGYSDKHVVVARNGQVIEVSKQGVKATRRKMNTDYVMVDGLGVGDVSHIVLRDRKAMASEGMVVIVVSLDREGNLIGSPDIISRGFVYVDASKELIEGIRQKVKQVIAKNKHLAATDHNSLRARLRDDVGQQLYTKTERRPLILPVVVEV
ncbi:ribonuclease J [Patescibacteria group bacterium]|nr:MAG: ribonuclease J [Patescibacteria group bacterium]